MANVYGQSHVNIMASSAENGTQGCFHEDELARCPPTRVAAKIFEKTEIYEAVSSDLYQLALVETPLAARG